MRQRQVLQRESLFHCSAVPPGRQPIYLHLIAFGAPSGTTWANIYVNGRQLERNWSPPREGWCHVYWRLEAMADILEVTIHLAAADSLPLRLRCVALSTEPTLAIDGQDHASRSGLDEISAWSGQRFEERTARDPLVGRLLARAQKKLSAAQKKQQRTGEYSALRFVNDSYFGLHAAHQVDQRRYANQAIDACEEVLNSPAASPAEREAARQILLQAQALR